MTGYNHEKFTDLTIKNLKPRDKRYRVRIPETDNLYVTVHPTGKKVWYFIYSFKNRDRFFKIGRYPATDLANARRRARALRVSVDEGKDPQAERRHHHGAVTFKKLYERFLEEDAKITNTSWEQTDYLIKRHVLEKWGTRAATQITGTDVWDLFSEISKTRPSLANQVKHAISAVFTFGERPNVKLIPFNPCRGIQSNPKGERNRVLGKQEFSVFWPAFDLAASPMRAKALRVLLLLGQRSGEVCAMRAEHIQDSWWLLPGRKIPELGWPGTKNKRDHRVWLPAKVRELIASTSTTGFVFTDENGNKPAGLDEDMRRICAALGVTEAVVPHDLRRTHGTRITGLGKGRDAMNRIHNRIRRSTTDIYDRYEYEIEDMEIMEDVAAAIMRLVEGKRE